MSEHRTLQTDPGGDWENRLRAGLHDLETTPAGLPGTDQVRRTHLRRRTALTAASALAAVVVAGGTVLALDRPGTSAPVAPTTTEPAPTVTAAPTPSATTPEPDPSTATRTTPAVAVPTTIPDGFVLPHEGEQSDDADVTDWELVEDPQISCSQQQSLDLSRASESRVIEQRGPEYSQSIGLLVHADVDDALALMSEVRGLGGCATGDSRSALADVDGPWGEAVVFVVAAPEGGVGATYWLLARTGTAVAVVGGSAEYLSAELPNPETVEYLVGEAEPLATRLCVFTVAGC